MHCVLVVSLPSFSSSLNNHIHILHSLATVDGSDIKHGINTFKAHGFWVITFEQGKNNPVAQNFRPGKCHGPGNEIKDLGKPSPEAAHENAQRQHNFGHRYAIEQNTQN
jgi:hypothetical protein